MNLIKAIMIVLIIAGIALIIEQYVNYGVLFELSDIHHETFIVAALFGAFIIYGITRGWHKVLLKI